MASAPPPEAASVHLHELALSCQRQARALKSASEPPAWLASMNWQLSGLEQLGQVLGDVFVDQVALERLAALALTNLEADLADLASSLPKDAPAAGGEAEAEQMARLERITTYTKALGFAEESQDDLSKSERFPSLVHMPTPRPPVPGGASNPSSARGPPTSARVPASEVRLPLMAPKLPVAGRVFIPSVCARRADATAELSSQIPLAGRQGSGKSVELASEANLASPAGSQLGWPPVAPGTPEPDGVAEATSAQSLPAFGASGALYPILVSPGKGQEGDGGDAAAGAGDEAPGAEASDEGAIYGVGKDGAAGKGSDADADAAMPVV